MEFGVVEANGNKLLEILNILWYHINELSFNLDWDLLINRILMMVNLLIVSDFI